MTTQPKLIPIDDEKLQWAEYPGSDWVIEVKAPDASNELKNVPSSPGPEGAIVESPDLLNTGTKLTSAQRLLCGVKDCADAAVVRPLTTHAAIMHAYGYKGFVKIFPTQQHAFMVLRASTATTIELNTLIAYPDSRGHGTVMMRCLCQLADDFGVDVWLDAIPFGRNRIHIPLKKLKRFYRRFGFADIPNAQPEWLCGFHQWDHSPLLSVMLRPARKKASR